MVKHLAFTWKTVTNSQKLREYIEKKKKAKKTAKDKDGKMCRKKTSHGHGLVRHNEPHVAVIISLRLGPSAFHHGYFAHFYITPEKSGYFVSYISYAERKNYCCLKNHRL